jgi:hypothetical protein
MRNITTISILENSNPRHLLVISLVYCMLLIRLIWFVDHNAVNVLFWDQWDFLIHLFNGNTNLWDNFMVQHGPHRQGLGGALLAVIYPLSGWNVRVEVFTAVGLVAVACLLAIVIKGKLFGSFHWTDSVIPLAYFSLLQFEIFVGTPNLAHGPVPILLTTLTAFVLTLKNQKVRNMLLVLLVFLTTYTGFAIFSGLVVMSLLFLFSIKSKSIGKRLWNIGALVLSLAVFGSFFLHYQHAPAVDCFRFPHPQPLQYFEFAFLQFGTAWGAPSLIHFPHGYYPIMLYSGLMFFLLMAVFGFYSYRTIKTMDQKSLVISYLASFTLLFLAFTAIGRVCLGLHGALASRYVTYSIPAMVAIYFGVLAGAPLFKLKKWVGNTAVLGLVLLFATKELSILHNREHLRYNREGKTDWVHCYLEERNIEQCDQKTGYKLYPNSPMIEKRIKYLEENNLNFFVEND